MLNIPIIDLIFALVVLFCALSCFYKGFVDSLFNKTAPIAAMWAAVLGWKKVAFLLNDKITIPVLNCIASFLIVFIVVFIIVKIIQTILGNIFDGKILGSLDRTLGFMFGVAEGLVIVLVALIILTLQPWFNILPLLEGSIFYSFFKPFVNASTDFITTKTDTALIFYKPSEFILNV